MFCPSYVISVQSEKTQLIDCQIYKLNNFIPMNSGPDWIGLWLAGQSLPLQHKEMKLA